MSLNRVTEPTEVYLRIINGTIARSQHLQDAAVLEQLRERWIRTLNRKLAELHADRLSTHPKASFQSVRPPTAVALSATPYGGNSTACSAPPSVNKQNEVSSGINRLHRAPPPTGGVYVPNLEGITTRAEPLSLQKQSVPLQTMVGLQQQQKSPPTKQQAFKFSLAPRKSPRDLSSSEATTQPGKRPCTEAAIAAVSSPTPTASPQGSPDGGADAVKEDEEDDWGGTEWTAGGTATEKETALPMKVEEVKTSPSGTEEEDDDDGFGNEEWVTASSAAPTSAETPKLSASSLGNSTQETGTISLEEPKESPIPAKSDGDPLNIVIPPPPDGLEDEELSDLDDEDPVTSDLIVAQFENIQRPHARKASQRGSWRIKLRNGILQLNGQEFLFHTLTGDLEF